MWKDKVILITGASSGIGEALVRSAIQSGAKVIAGARRAPRLQSLRESLGDNVWIRTVDVTNPTELAAFVNDGIRHWGRLDLAVANAGFGVTGDFDVLTPEDFRRQFETNVYGVLSTAQLCLPHLVRFQGSLCLLGSVMSYISLPGSAPYSMSKFAIKALADSLYHEYRPRGVGIILVCPGLVESEIREVDNEGTHHPHSRDPLPRWAVMPKMVAAQKILKACAQRRREIAPTLHAKIGIFVVRHFPWLFHKIIQTFGLKSGQQKSAAARAKNSLNIN